jgi:hypothetical protein
MMTVYFFGGLPPVHLRESRDCIWLAASSPAHEGELTAYTRPALQSGYRLGPKVEILSSKHPKNENDTQ